MRASGKASDRSAQRILRASDAPEAPKTATFMSRSSAGLLTAAGRIRQDAFGRAGNCPRVRRHRARGCPRPPARAGAGGTQAGQGVRPAQGRCKGLGRTHDDRRGDKAPHASELLLEHTERGLGCSFRSWLFLFFKKGTSLRKRCDRTSLHFAKKNSKIPVSLRRASQQSVLYLPTGRGNCVPSQQRCMPRQRSASRWPPTVTALSLPARLKRPADALSGALLGASACSTLLMRRTATPPEDDTVAVVLGWRVRAGVCGSPSCSGGVCGGERGERRRRAGVLCAAASYPREL